MLVFAVVAVLGFFAFGFFTRVPKAQTLSVEEAEKLMAAEPELQVIDVRTRMEFESGAIRGARLIPLQELGWRASEIDPGKPLLLYCRSAHRSGVAMQILRKRGYSRAVHLEGGILAWQKAGKVTV